MSELPITCKDDVETALVYDCRDMSTLQGVKYSYWVLGSALDDDALYMGTIKGNTPPSEHVLEQIKEALSQVPAECIFPPLPFPWWLARTRVTVADDWDKEPSPDLYLKRPWITNLDAQPGENNVARWFAHEIKQLEQLARSPPHPNLLRYHGCRVRNGRVTGALLARVPGRDLESHLQNGGTVDKDLFFAALASAVDYLHNVVGLVHNDISPSNAMVGPDGAPTLIDLGSAYPDGEEMLANVPYTYFVGPLTASPMSRKSRDIASLNHLRTWIENPVIETAGRRRRNETASHFFKVGSELHQAATARQKAIRAKAAEGNETAA
ncbi:hypothetical protein B0T24DRAFT_695654 [Lasiosphaeria ovina]|uniref:Protein kinase domain-containing protein n=1 Tax=Lasiosphaeria ovina TaxID=92902 RepID=A0AAE0NDU6_9PEZI|nr:hypothetical protein B0T24DRAFT_695654 [Lasiosphaeria ovina]